jgi:hypothetical protein
MEEILKEFEMFGCLRCRCCNNKLDKDKWFSEWDNNNHVDMHYKSIVCSCGKKMWVKLDFLGSGHDHIVEDDNSSIESAVRKVQEG